MVNGYNEGFAEALVAQGLITEVQLGEAAEAARQQNSTIPTMLVRSGYITSEQLMDALSAFMDAPRVKLNPQAIVGEVAKLLDADKAWEHRVRSRTRSTTPSPYMVGVVATLKSTSAPPYFTKMTPSWGRRRSAMSSLERILIRETTAWCCSPGRTS